MEDIRVEELKAKMNSGDEFILIDVRELFEREAFNIGGKHIPLSNLPASIPELREDQDKEIILYCRSGGRSGQAKLFMEQLGFPKVRNLLGGMLDWSAKFSK